MVLVQEAAGRAGAAEVVVHQLLCGREIAKDGKTNVAHRFARQMSNYVYLVVDTVDRVAAVVDPAWDVDGVFEVCSALGVEVKAALFTHRHFDHTGGVVPRSMTGAKQDITLPGVADFVERGIRVYVGARDAASVAKQTRVPLGQISQAHEGDEVRLSERLALGVLETPGHTPGSVCFQAGDVLFTGDTLFIGSCGRVDLPESDVAAMLASLAKLGGLPGSTIVMPGHNYAMLAHSTIDEERAANSMMMQALARRAKSAGASITSEPVAALLPLPDYLGVARRLFEQSSVGGGRACQEHGEHHASLQLDEPVASDSLNAQQLESHF